jgi:hypothetical protein
MGFAYRQRQHHLAPVRLIGPIDMAQGAAVLAEDRRAQRKPEVER